MAAHPALAGRVTFPGQLDREELGQVLARAHVFVFPSLWGEPFALAPLEAMAFGLALVTSDAGGSPEQAEHGSEALVVPAGDVDRTCEALVALANDEELRRSLARAGRARVLSRYTQARFVDGLERAARRAAGIVFA